MINIKINPYYRSRFNISILENAALTTLSFNKLNINSDLSIVIVGNKKIQELNYQFSNIDAPTDVLSFPSVEVDPENGREYIGDIIISFPKAKSQALKSQHTVEDELQLLTIHGMLHLIGFDHACEEEKIIMWNNQQSILDILGSKIII